MPFAPFEKTDGTGYRNKIATTITFSCPDCGYAIIKVRIWFGRFAFYRCPMCYQRGLALLNLKGVK